MQSHRLHVTIPKNRRAIVQFPEAVPTGEIELIVLIPAEDAETTDEGFPVFAVPPDAKPITPEMVQRALEEG